MVRTLMWTGIFILLLLAGYWWTKQQSGVDPALKGIIQNYVAADRTLNDPTNAIGVSSVDNIGFERKGNTLFITYGKQAFKVNLDKNTADIAGYMNALGLSIEFNSASDVVLKYHGKVVKEFE